MLLKRLSVYFCPLLIFLGLELMFFQIKIIPACLIFIFIILLIFLKFLIREKIFSLNFFYLSILPFLLIFLAIGWLFILNEDWLRHLIIFILVFILGLYLENIYLFFYYPAFYQIESLENFSAFLNLLIFFLLAINLNTLNVFLNFQIWLLSLILVAFLSLLILQSFWANKLKTKIRFIYLLILNIIILEIFWGLFFLPTNFYVNSLILTIFFYFSWGIFKSKLKEKLDKRSLQRYLIISIILLLLAIMTSSWI